MEELKSCIFCGKGVDRDFAYCPWCGYEFGPGDDEPGRRADQAAEAQHAAESRSAGYGAQAEGAAHGGAAGVAPAAEPAGPSAPPSVLLRLTALEELLAGIEQELDRMLRSGSGGP
jgi:hypothetical protein